MSDVSKIANTSVEDIFKSTPGAVRLFLDWHTGCVGCGFARFCTLAEVAALYKLPLETLFQELNETLPTQTKRGETV
jgi:hypothetical protein